MSNKDEIEVNIDKIQASIFHYLAGMIKKRMPEKKVKKKKAVGGSDDGPARKKQAT